MTLCLRVRLSRGGGGSDRLPDFDCMIRLHGGTTFTDTIRGRLYATAHKAYDFHCLWVQLEGHATSRFQTKLDGRISNHICDEQFLPRGCRAVLIGQNPETPSDHSPSEAVSLPEGAHVFPFEIKLDSHLQYPCTFQSEYGRIQYKLIAKAITYRKCWQESIVAKKVMVTTGHFNLHLDPLLSAPLVVTRKRTKSFFVKRSPFTVNFKLEKKGYLPGEQISGQLDVDNPGKEGLPKMELNFVQRIIYFDNQVSKSTVAKLEELEYTCENNSNKKIVWDFNLIIPTNLMPTFTKEPKSVEILYFLQFAVHVSDGSQLKGEAEVVIGSEARHLSKAEEEAHEKSERGPSASSPTSHSSPPPSYSELGQRRPSLANLPPEYDSVVGFDNWEDSQSPPEFRQRSYSNST